MVFLAQMVESIVTENGLLMSKSTFRNANAINNAQVEYQK